MRFSLKIATGTAPCDDADPVRTWCWNTPPMEAATGRSSRPLNEASFPLFTPVTVAVPPAAHARHPVPLASAGP